jgi:hypothetical protein
MSRRAGNNSGFLLGLLLKPEDGVDILLREVGELLSNYKAL